MKNYCHVTNWTVDYVGALPQSYASVSGLNMITDDAELASHGWLPHVEVHPTYNNKTHRLENYDIDIQVDKVVYTDIVIPFTDAEMVQNSINDTMTMIYVLEKQTQNRRLIRDAMLGIVKDKPGHPDHGKTGQQRLQELEDLLQVERDKL